MSAVLADTHAALWYLLEPSQLSAAADHALTQADQPGAGIFVSAITVVEAIYLVEKARLPPGGPRQTPCELLRGACLCQVYRPTIAGQVAPEPGTRRLVWPHLAWARSRGTFAKSWIRASKGGRGIC